MAFKRPRAGSPSGAQKRSRGSEGSNRNLKLGTEIPLEEDGDEGSFVPVWKQTVTDERGRRRLHGAFTGGFSAGYFNTVGSKEGWTPKTFVSSRSNRKKDQTSTGDQRPEDFMDEEDLAAAAESRQLETVNNFATVGNSDQRAGMQDEFFGLFMTEEDTMGMKILQKMGWRRDQGIGRKVRRSAEVENAPKSNEVKSAASRHTFAPKDVQYFVMNNQSDRKGLGFRSEARLETTQNTDAEQSTAFELPYTGPKSQKAIGKKPIAKKSSFGVGVLNDTGSDEEDPYELGPKISFNKTIGKDKKVKKPSKFAKPGSADRHVFVPTRVTGKPVSALVRTTADGRVALRGFVFAVEFIFQAPKPKFPPPQVPPGWEPAKSTNAVADDANFQSVADAAKKSALTAKARADLLGEASLPGKSVFDFMTKETRDKIAAATGKTDIPQGLGQTAPAGHVAGSQRDLWSFVPALDKNVAAAALAKGATGWMPYAEDLKKRARYVAYLELRAADKQELPERVPGTSVSDWAKELQEFAHAAEVFKPTSGIMASRFTSSSSTTQPTSSSNGDSNNLLRKPVPKPEDPAEQAAKMSMYGPMTRSQLPFHPSRLLCKRFNVPPPPDVPLSTDDDTQSGGGKTQEAVSKSDLDRMMREMQTRSPAVQRPAWMHQSKDAAATPATADGEANNVASTSASADHAVVDVEKNDALTMERAPDDVFKAIFGDSDDDDE